MSQRKKRDLLGFLLGALDSADHDEVAKEIDEHPELGTEAAHVRRNLKRLALDCRPDHELPPPNLAAKTCEWVFAQIPHTLGGTLARLSEPVREELEIRPRNSYADLVVAVCVLLVAAGVFLPALQVNRQQAGVMICQQKIKQLGFALHEYSNHQPDGSYPRLELRGNRAAAGVYAPMLMSKELVMDPKKFVCPRSPLADMLAEWELPSLAEIDDAVGDTLARLQQRMGGSYGYTLGHMEGDRYVSPFNQQRELYALLGDAPSRTRKNRFSDNHGGRGQNVFFEDGHVKFVSMVPKDGPMDDPFFNRQGLVVAGVDRNDSVLGTSEARPITEDMMPVEMAE
jgi:hypothetical protein